MALLPYILRESSQPSAPLIVDSPHSGRIYPVDFAYACPLPLLRQAEDAYVDELIEGATEAGATVLMAEFPRTMIDVNRAEDDIDPAGIDGAWPRTLNPTSATLSGFGLVRRLCRRDIDLYRAPLTVAEIERRLAVYYRPYHQRLQSLVETCTRQHGVCYVIDAHSMPDRVDNGIPRADFILGDRDGTSCESAFTQRAQKILQDMGYSVWLNETFKGREIVQRYGLTGQGAQAMQLEINRKLYLNEEAVEKHQGFSRLRQNMAVFFQALAAALRSETDDRLAAE